MEADSAGDAGDAERSTRLVFVSDASAEAGRISMTLGELGYTVADVPLVLLAGRVAVQRPALVVFDADAEGAVEALQRLREPSEKPPFQIVVLGEKDRLGELAVGLADAVFARPVDVREVLDTIQRSVGAPQKRPSRLPVSSRSPGRQSALPSSRPSDRAVRAENPQTHSAAIPLPPDLTGEGPPPRETSDAPVVELGRDMQNVLLEAERRFGDSKPTKHLNRDEHGPEVDAEAPLPPEVLLALEEPLDDEDFSEEGQTPMPQDATGALTAAKLGTRGPHTGGTFATSLGTDATAAPASESSGNTRTGGRSRVTEGPGPPDFPVEGPVEQEARRVRQQASTPKPPKPVAEAPSEPAPPPSSIPPALPASKPPPTASDHPIPEPPGGRTGHTIDQPIPTSRPGGLPPPLSHHFDDVHVEEPSDAERIEYVRRALSSTTPPLRGRSESEAPAEDRPADPRALAPDRVSDRPSDPRAGMGETSLTVPARLRAGEAVDNLAKAIARRYTGALAFEVDEGIRRIVLREGDLVSVATGVHGESLVAFLASRGDLPPEVARQAHKLPAFGRRAGAALIAHGHLAQDELWPVLRAHAEWLVGKVLEIERGSVVAEEIGRLSEEPAVFGGATGAEVLVEVVRRVITPEEALGRLGGLDAQLGQGPMAALLGECALAPSEAERVQLAASTTVRDLIDASPDPALCSTLYALVCLGVLSSQGLRPKSAPERPKPIRDELDDEALRGRILARKALVDEGDYFAVLGVSRDATGYDIRRAFTTLRRELEPSNVLTPRTADLSDIVTEIISVLEEAYQILSDQRRRERYRRAIEATP